MYLCIYFHFPKLCETIYIVYNVLVTIICFLCQNTDIPHFNGFTVFSVGT